MIAMYENVGAVENREREEFLREMDDRVRNNLSLLLALVKIHMNSPPPSSLAVLSRMAGQIMALSTAYDLEREGGADSDSRNAAELYSRLISGIERDLHRGAIRFTADTGSAAIPSKATATLGVLFGEMLFDAIDRASRAGQEPEIEVALKYEGHCRFVLRVADKSPPEEGRLAAETLAKALGGELRTIGDAAHTERELVFGTHEPDGSCKDEDGG